MQERDDIVLRLRRDCMSLIADEAADEIDMLREKLTSVNAERLHAVSSLADEVARLIRERDEARHASAAWIANLAEPQEIDPADLQALIDATWKDDRLTVRMSARDLWRMASDHRGRNEE